MRIAACGCILFLATAVSATGAEGDQAAMRKVSYSDARLSYYGRWEDHQGIGKRTGWISDFAMFRVTGAKSLNLRLGGSALAYATVVVDNNDVSNYGEGAKYPATTATVDGDRVTTVALPDGGEHRILFKLADGINQMLSPGSLVFFKGIEVPESAVVSEWKQAGEKTLVVFMDSWGGAENDYPRFMFGSKWTVISHSVGGFTSASTKEMAFRKYPCDPKTPATDPPADAYLVSHGVNDHHAGITLATFKANYGDIVDQIVAHDPGKPIYLKQVPRNVKMPTIPNYDKYGEVMSELAAERQARGQKVYYLSSQALWEKQALFGADAAHLSWHDPNGRQALADDILAQLDAIPAQ
jgi:hypothetical protein